MNPVPASLMLISSEFPPGPGGIGSHAYQLAAHLARLGWKITVVAPQDYAQEPEIARFTAGLAFSLSRVTSGRGRAREAWNRVRVAQRLMKQVRPDILIGTGLSGVWVASMVAAWNGVPAIAVAHGSEFGKLGRMVGWVNRMAFNRMTKIIAVSDFTKSVVIRSGIRPRSIEVIRNGADAGRFVVLDEARKREFRPGCIPADARVLLTVGHVSERKGQEIVIRAMPEVLKVHPNVHYCMAGLPTLRGRLEGIARELGVFEHVHFLGAVSPEELVAWINRCDLFVMTSKTTANGDCEGFGIAVVEAALCGKAAVVSAQSGLIEAIVEGVTGESVEEGNSEATAGAINRLLGDNARLASMGAAARQRAEAEQTWDSCIARFDRVLGESIRSKAG